MSKKAHTEGPWLVEPHGKTHALYSRRDYRYHGLRLMNLDDGDANFEANARLIAAAPDLLEALQILLTVAEMTTFSDQFPQECENARAALSKATGGE